MDYINGTLLVLLHQSSIYIALYTAPKMKGTLNCHIKSLKLEGYQSVQLQSISDCESVSLALVLMKVTTGALERQDNPPKSKEF